MNKSLMLLIWIVAYVTGAFVQYYSGNRKCEEYIAEIKELNYRLDGVENELGMAEITLMRAERAVKVAEIIWLAQ